MSVENWIKKLLQLSKQWFSTHYAFLAVVFDYLSLQAVYNKQHYVIDVSPSAVSAGVKYRDKTWKNVINFLSGFKKLLMTRAKTHCNLLKESRKFGDWFWNKTRSVCISQIWCKSGSSTSYCIRFSEMFGNSPIFVTYLPTHLARHGTESSLRNLWMLRACVSFENSFLNVCTPGIEGRWFKYLGSMGCRQNLSFCLIPRHHIFLFLDTDKLYYIVLC